MRIHDQNLETLRTQRKAEIAEKGKSLNHRGYRGRQRGQAKPLTAKIAKNFRESGKERRGREPERRHRYRREGRKEKQPRDPEREKGNAHSRSEF